MLRNWLILLSFFTGLAPASGAIAAETTLRMTTSVSAPLYFEDGSGLFDQLTREIFARLGLEYEMIWLPAQRSLVDTDNGPYDGIVARTSAIEARLPNLLRVPVNVFDFEFMAYVKDDSIRIRGWDSLQPYAVGYINGWKIVEQNTLGARSISSVNDYGQLLSLLDRGRVEIAVLDRIMGGFELRRLGYDLSIAEPPLAVRPNYIYLHRRHAALVPRMAEVIEAMKKDGSFASIYARALAR